MRFFLGKVQKPDYVEKVTDETEVFSRQDKTKNFRAIPEFLS